MTTTEASKAPIGALATAALYGLFSAGGGLMGFISAGSLASLIAGGTAGLLLLTGAWLMRTDRVRNGAILASVVSLALLARFAPAALRNVGGLPWIMVGGALATLITCGAVLLRRR